MGKNDHLYIQFRFDSVKNVKKKKANHVNKSKINKIKLIKINEV